jgi:hypothetical protein
MNPSRMAFPAPTPGHDFKLEKLLNKCESTITLKIGFPGSFMGMEQHGET